MLEMTCLDVTYSLQISITLRTDCQSVLTDIAYIRTGELISREMLKLIVVSYGSDDYIIG